MEVIALKKFGTSLNSRALADDIFSKVTSGANVEIDFKDVASASPSFCHEMLVVLKKMGTNAKFLNTNQTVQFQINKAANLPA